MRDLIHKTFEILNGIHSPVIIINKNQHFTFIY